MRVDACDDDVVWDCCEGVENGEDPVDEAGDPAAPADPMGPNDKRVADLERQIHRLEVELQKLQLCYSTQKHRIKVIEQLLQGDLDEATRARLNQELADLRDTCEHLEVRMKQIETAILAHKAEVDAILGIKALKIHGHPFPNNLVEFEVKAAHVTEGILYVEVQSKETHPALYELYWTGKVAGHSKAATVYICAPNKPLEDSEKDHHFTLRFDLTELRKKADTCYLETTVVGSHHHLLWGLPGWNL